MLDKSAQAGQHSYAERGDDAYQTPVVAVQALMQVEKLPERIWEPACGSGNIVHTLRAAGHTVYASDIVDYGCGHSPVDFLTTDVIPPAQAIITNPPFKLAQKFIERGLQICPQVIVLLRLAFYESERRSKLLEESGLVRIHVFKERLPMMHRLGYGGPKASSAICFGWFVWERGYRGPTVIDRISWKPVKLQSKNGYSDVEGVSVESN